MSENECVFEFACLTWDVTQALESYSHQEVLVFPSPIVHRYVFF